MGEFPCFWMAASLGDWTQEFQMFLPAVRMKLLRAAPLWARVGVAPGCVEAQVQGEEGSSGLAGQVPMRDRTPWAFWQKPGQGMALGF